MLQQPLHKTRADIGELEGMKSEMTGEFLASQNAAHTVALGIQLRGIDADAQLPVHYAKNTAADSALGRKADFKSPATRVIVKPAGEHHRQNVLDVLEIKDVRLGDRVGAHVGQGRSHHGHVLTGDQQGALREILVQRLVHLLVNDAKVVHEIGDGAVTVASERLGLHHRQVDAQIPARSLAHLIDKGLNTGLYRRLLDQRSDGDGARVNHGIEGPRGLGVQLDGVEGIAARLNTDVFEGFVHAALFQGHLEGKRLAHGLDREFLVPITRADYMAIHRNQADAEVIRVGFAQLGDVSRDGSVIDILIFFISIVDDCLYLRQLSRSRPLGGSALSRTLVVHCVLHVRHRCDRLFAN